MKKISLLLALTLFCTTAANAQGWKDALKKAATTAADNATGGQLTAAAIHGAWHYSHAGSKFEGDNLASEVGGAAIETAVNKQLEKGYAMAGIKPGACSFTFNEDASFSAQMGTHELSGTYEFEASTHTITLHFAKGKLNLGSIPGHAYISGGELALVFPVNKLVDIVTAVGSKVGSLSSAVKMLEKYKNVYIGFAFKK